MNDKQENKTWKLNHWVKKLFKFFKEKRFFKRIQVFNLVQNKSVQDRAALEW